MPTMNKWQRLGSDHCAPDNETALVLWESRGHEVIGKTSREVKRHLKCSWAVARMIRYVVTGLGMPSPPPLWPLGYAKPGKGHPDPQGAWAALRAQSEPDSLQSPSSDATSDPWAELDGDGVAIEDLRKPHHEHIPESDTYRITINGGAHRLNLPGETVRGIRRDYSNMVGRGLTQAEIARKFAIPKAHLGQVLTALGITHSDDPFTDEEIDAIDPALLLEEARHIRRAKLGTAIERQQQRDLERDAQKWRRLEDAISESTAAAVGRIQEGGISIPRYNMAEPSGPYAVLVGLSDFHYNMLSGDESRTPYSREIARRDLRLAMGTLIREIAHRGRPERIILHLAGDNEHTEGHARTTSRGTPQVCEVDPRQAHEEFLGLVWSEVVMPFAAVAPVEGYLTPGNHAEGMEAATGAALRLLASGTDGRVSFKWALKPRLYAEYGRCAIQLSHGHNAGAKRLRDLFAAEQPELWGRSRLRLACQGHLHHDHTKDELGLTWVLWPSLSGTCSWAERKGFTGSQRRMDAFMLHPDGRMIGRVYGHPVR